MLNLNFRFLTCASISKSILFMCIVISFYVSPLPPHTDAIIRSSPFQPEGSCREYVGFFPFCESTIWPSPLLLLSFHLRKELLDFVPSTCDQQNCSMSRSIKNFLKITYQCKRSILLWNKTGKVSTYTFGIYQNYVL